MQDHTLLKKRNARSYSDGNLSAEQVLCCIPHCERQRADRVNIHLCEKHIEKAWAAYQVLNGFELEEAVEPERDRTSIDAKGIVYVIRVGDLIKIGWTSDPNRRMRALQPDAVLHYRSGSRRDEYRLQALCIDHLAKGREWFTANDEMAEIVNNIRSGKKVA